MFANGVIVGKTADNQEVWSRCDTADNHIHDDFINEEVVRDIIGTITAGDEPFIRLTLDMDAPVGRSALVETKPSDITFYARRGDRTGLSRMVLRDEKELTNVATIIMCRDKEHDGRLTIASAYPGEQGEREPWDESIKDDPELLEKSEEFWSKYALVADEAEKRQLVDQYYKEREWLDSYLMGGMLALEWDSRDRELRSWYSRVISKIER